MNPSTRNATDPPAAAANYFDLSSDEKLAAITEAWGAYDPDATRAPRLMKGGYYNLPLQNPRSAQHPGYGNDYDAVTAEVLGELPDVAAKTLAKAKAVLGEEFKIHLMPQGQFALHVLKTVLVALKEDREVQSRVCAMKIIDISRLARMFLDDIFPTIVIYPQLGKNNAQYVLRALCERLQPSASLGEGKSPRYNQKINELVFYAQAGGGFKTRFIDAMMYAGRDPRHVGLFEPDFVHLEGDYHLSVAPLSS